MKDYQFDAIISCASVLLRDASECLSSDIISLLLRDGWWIIIVISLPNEKNALMEGIAMQNTHSLQSTQY